METHLESPINHAEAYVFSEIKRISQENYLVKSVEDAARWNNQHLVPIRSGHPAISNHIFSRVLKGQSLWNSQHLPEDGWIPTHPAISNQVLKGQPHHTKKKYRACMNPLWKSPV